MQAVTTRQDLISLELETNTETSVSERQTDWSAMGPIPDSRIVAPGLGNRTERNRKRKMK